MSTPHPARKRLPERPSEENLRKQAKRRAKDQSVPLAEAQHATARDYGFVNWAKLIEHVRSIAHSSGASESHAEGQALGGEMVRAAAVADPEYLSRLLAGNASVKVWDANGDPLLSLVCRSNAPPENRLAAAKVLIDAGAHLRAFAKDGSTALHWAAWHGPVAMAELLIKSGAKEWQTDKQSRKPLDYAREGIASDKARLVELLDRPVIRDPAFRDAVKAIQSGDLPALKRLLATHPNLVRDRAVEPECYPQDYFRDPRLLWFVANNPDFIQTMPANTIEIARAIIDAGAEQSDLQYTLGLVMTSGPARKQGLQRPLIHLLLECGARIEDTSFLGSLGHGERDAVAAVLETGVPVTLPVAAGMGRIDDLKRLLPTATDDQKHQALSVAVINRELEAARLCLEAGADVNRFSAMHQHSMPIHQATVNGDLSMMKLLVEHGARLDIRDTMWDGTPLGWAIHTNQPQAEAYLRSIGAP